MNTGQSEIWAKIPEINYEASIFGRIRHCKTKTIKGAWDNGRGYLSFVSYTTGRPKIHYVHRCILLAFDPIDSPENFDANHKDFDRTNNNLSNLEWKTRVGNLLYSRERGRYKEANQKQAEWMRENSKLLNLGWGRKGVVAHHETAILEFDSQVECAKYFGVSAPLLCDRIKKNKTVGGFQVVQL